MVKNNQEEEEGGKWAQSGATDGDPFSSANVVRGWVGVANHCLISFEDPLYGKTRRSLHDTYAIVTS